MSDSEPDKPGDDPTRPSGDMPARPGEPVLPAAEAGAEAPAVDGATCILCGATMYGVHCKLICPNCGYREDCSDLFPA